MDFGHLGDTFLSFLDKIPVLRAILGVIIVFFVPGFAWTLALFHKIKTIERIGLSIGLSVAITTLSILVLNLVFGLTISGTNALITIAVMTIIPLGIYLARRYYFNRKPEATDGE
jgi:uncharacterized membrane protein